MKKTIIALCIAGLFAVVTAINLDFVSENGNGAVNLAGLAIKAIAGNEDPTPPLPPSDPPPSDDDDDDDCSHCNRNWQACSCPSGKVIPNSLVCDGDC